MLDIKDTTMLDPVCGMMVSPETAAGSFEYKGETYYFCSLHCLNRFREDPEKFLSKAPGPQPIGMERTGHPRSKNTPVANDKSKPAAIAPGYEKNKPVASAPGSDIDW